jgi:hypothetical protein
VTRTLLLVGAVLCVGCGPKGDVHTYDNSLFRLGSGFSAKEVCSCVFVMERDEDFCRQWTRVSPDIARFTVDRDARQVHARALGLGHTVARWVDDETGCVIVE